MMIDKLVSQVTIDKEITYGEMNFINCIIFSLKRNKERKREMKTFSS